MVPAHVSIIGPAARAPAGRVKPPGCFWGSVVRVGSAVRAFYSCAKSLRFVYSNVRSLRRRVCTACNGACWLVCENIVFLISTSLISKLNFM